MMTIEAKEYKYKFSIIMSVYNVEDYINEAVDSILNQDIGFEENVQIVFVDDGSTDSSGKICDEYKKKFPDNVVILHKKNEGLAKARVDGIRLAEGKYISFFDPDDILSRPSLKNIYFFFEEKYKEIDVVAMPMIFFGEQEGQHPLNGKFKKGSRVINLLKEYRCIQLSLASCVIKAEVADLIEADSDIVTAEDAKELVKILLQKNRLGVVKEATYNYRKRSLSSVGGAKTKPGWYTIYLNNYSEYIMEYSRSVWGFVPKYIQYMVMYDLQWKLQLEDFPKGVLSDSEAKLFIGKLFDVIKKIDDDVIIDQKNLSCECKVMLLKNKYEHFYRLETANDYELFFSEKASYFFSNNIGCKIEFIKIENNHIYIDGRIQFFAGEKMDIVIECNEKYLYPILFKREDDLKSLGIPVASYQGFAVKINLNEVDTIYKIRICLKKGDIVIPLQRIVFGQFAPLNNQYENMYYAKNGWKITYANNTFFVNKVNKNEVAKSEFKLLGELWKKNGCGERKAVLARICYKIIRGLKNRPLWVLSDRAIKADDNGLALFNYLRNNHKEINSYFVISDKSPDYKKLKKDGKILIRDSYAHKMSVLLSDRIISSHAEIEIYNPFYGYESAYRDILADNSFIFLQHGITKDDVSRWLNKYNKNICGFITAANPEYDSIVKGETYYYEKEKIWLTGFPRFDRLYYNEQKQITIMPTWRRYLAKRWIRESDRWILVDNFEESEFYKAYHNLLNDERLLKKAKELGYSIAFFPHPNLQDHVQRFKANESIKILGRETNYRDVYAESNLIITDYSSAVFDFAYLRKPIIYFQFDAKDFFAGAHVYDKGYFDYKENGFGEVESTFEGLVDRIIEYMETGCNLKSIYRKRIDSFFAFSDQNNCERVFNKIVALNNQKTKF